MLADKGARPLARDQVPLIHQAVKTGNNRVARDRHHLSQRPAGGSLNPPLSAHPESRYAGRDTADL